MNKFKDFYDDILSFLVILSVLTIFLMVCVIGAIHFLIIGKWIYAVTLFVITPLIIGWLILSLE